MDLNKTTERLDLNKTFNNSVRPHYHFMLRSEYERSEGALARVVCSGWVACFGPGLCFVWLCFWFLQGSLLG
jgi:hypothetical protein